MMDWKQYWIYLTVSQAKSIDFEQDLRRVREHEDDDERKATQKIDLQTQTHILIE